MQLPIAEARSLVEAAMAKVGHSAEDSKIITDHLIDCELRGVQFGGLPRALSIIERIQGRPDRRKPLEVTHETPVSAFVEGGDQVGYLVAHKAAVIAIDKAKKTGIGIVGANDTWYTGMFSYYMEMAAKADMVAMAIGNASPRVAPFGSTQGRFGTNPISFGFPTNEDPVIWDIGTSAIMAGEVALALRMGQPLAEGMAFDRDGNPTRDPKAAGEGAYASWGGHKGSGLAICVQMLGMMCNTLPFPPLIEGCGFLLLVMSPGLFMPVDKYRDNASAYAKAVRAAKPVDPKKPVRMPFDRSAAERRRILQKGSIEAAPNVLEKLRAVAGR
jgi:LDH2 family malate/lactate/ureidoglycolate dehydrogenase